MGDLRRFGVAMEPELLERFDEYVARRGSNRSEALRDLVRGALVEAEGEDTDLEVVGTLTMVFDHHARDLSDRLDAIQHDHFREIVSTTHVHLDAHNCLEVLIMRGSSARIRRVADLLLGAKGVQHGRLVTTLATVSPSHPEGPP